MKLAVMQPYFFPYIGYWQLINAVDKFVLYDDVNFIKKGWINRNRILVNQKELVITLPLIKPSQNKLINETEIYGGNDKIIETIFHAYRKAPYFDSTMSVIEKILFNPSTNLALFLESSIRNICDYIGIRSEIIISSGINKNNSLRSQDKILDICNSLGADNYINSTGGQALYNSSLFKERGIRLDFIRPLPVVYKQFGTQFVPALSIIDVLMFNSPGHTHEQINNFELLQQ